jgi:uncharacterized protein (TIGR02145 family)
VHPHGQQFDKWTTASSGVVFADSGSATTTFTMPANAVTVTANFIIPSETFIDSRDGKTYRIITISGYVWMAENLNYETANSWCYNDDISACDKYGRLYTWNAATTACPTGWHLPTRTEWSNWISNVGSSTAGTKLKAKSPDWNGTDDYGFSALPAGIRDNSNGNFESLGSRSRWWTATQNSTTNAYRRDIETDLATVPENNYNKNIGYSVRCMKD